MLTNVKWAIYHEQVAFISAMQDWAKSPCNSPYFNQNHTIISIDAKKSI